MNCKCDTADKRMKVLQIALSMYGETEIPGEKHNPLIVQLWDALRLNVTDDETPWCSAFVNYCMKKANIESSQKANARSFLHWGKRTSDPKLGDVVVFWRESPLSWKGHVAFFIRQDDKNIWVLGGNQSNTIKISAYSKERLLEFRSYV